MKEKGSIRNLLRLIKTDKRYWAVFLGLVLISIFGRNIALSENRCATLPDPKTDGYILVADQDTYAVDNLLSSTAGDYYRLRFRAKALSPGAQIQPPEIASALDSVKVEVNLLGQGGEKMTIRTISLPQDGKEHPFEAIFETDAQYRSLEFKRIDQEKLSQVKIGYGIRLSRLNIQHEAEVAGLKPTITGDAASFGNYPAISPGGSKVFYSFNRRSLALGQTFKAESNQIAAVEFKLHFLGNGGAGSYHLTLHQVQDGEINNSELASFDFDAAQAEGRYQIDYANEIYKFPLAANLETGKDYLVTIDSNNVETNYIHHLQVFGFSQDIYGFGKAMKISHNLLGRTIGDSYFQILYREVDSNNFPDGSILEDMGGGLSIYQYQNLGDPADIFAVDSVKGPVEFNNNQKSIVNQSANDNATVYRFDLTAVPKSIYIYADQIGGDYVNSVLEFSFDQATWQQIVHKDPENSPDTFEINLHNSLARTLYLRVSYDKNDVGEKGTRLFGLKTLKVVSTLSGI